MILDGSFSFCNTEPPHTVLQLNHMGPDISLVSVFTVVFVNLDTTGKICEVLGFFWKVCLIMRKTYLLFRIAVR